ncbi:MAG: V-type ATP synthase subunit D [PVC group bacterium]
MARYQIAPTKTNLFKLKQSLEFAREGYELMEQKRQILVAEMMGLLGRTRELEETVDRQLSEAYRSLHQAVIRMGKNPIYQAADAVSLPVDISVSARRIMGVKVPLVEMAIQDASPYFSLLGTSFWLDVSSGQFQRLLQSLAKLAQFKISVLRLAEEVKKTVRRVNSLEKIAIPDYEETLQYIQDVLEEQERENFFIIKLLKSRMDRRKAFKCATTTKGGWSRYQARKEHNI